ncbi:MAG: hypothetical protein ABWX74_07845 [Aeromicrobium sp.]
MIASLALFMSLGGTSYAAVKAKSIGNKQLKNNSVTSAKIARNGVTASDIRAGVIDGTKIRAGSIGSQHILDGSITSMDIQDGTIGSQDIQDSSIGAQDIADGSIGASEIANGSLRSDKFDQATANQFRDVPVDLVLTGGGNSSLQGIPKTGTDPSDPNFTTVRSFSVPSAGTGKTGTNLIQSSVSVSSATDAAVTCWISVGAAGTLPENAVTVSAATATASSHAVIPVTGLVRLIEGDIVETRCAADVDGATADTRIENSATSMILMRVAS